MKDREDDVTTDRLLRRALHGDAARGATPECVDPETLAAWMEGSLAGDSLARAERHASDCARCQAMLAAMARTAPSEAPRPWWRTLSASWLVPAAAAATVFALWVAVDRERTVPPVPARPSQAEHMDAPDPAGVALGPDVGNARPAAAMPKASDDHLASRLEPRESSAAEVPPPTRSRDRGTAATKSEKRDTAVPDAHVLERRAAAPDRSAFVTAPPPAASASQRSIEAPPTPVTSSTPAEPAPGPPQPVAALPTVAESSAPKALAETVTITARSPRDSSAGAAGGGIAQRAVEIVSPEPAFRWRILSPAIIQRSTDGGARWTSQSDRAPGLSFLGKAQNALPPPRLNAGSAPARDICWIVGSDGIVLLSTDGISWQRRPFSEPVNLTAIRAVDAKTAVLTTGDGRQFSTTDGGATWSKIP